MANQTSLKSVKSFGLKDLLLIGSTGLGLWNIHTAQTQNGPTYKAKPEWKWSLMTLNWFKGQFWPYPPAILQVKVFYSSSIVLENRIACERCQKYFKVKLNDLPTVYDHWLKVTGLLIKVPDPLYPWRTFTGGWYIFLSRSDTLFHDRKFWVRIV